MQEWYLMTNENRPHMLGGFENDSFNEYKEDSIDEVLETDFATTVTIYNPDLSKSRKVRCIVQDNVANTLLNSLERCMLFHIGTIKAGNYVFFDNRYWLVTGYPGNNGVYEKVTLSLCQYCIRWQDSDKNIFDRWVSLSSASKYEMGENNRTQYTLATNSLIMLVASDEHTLALDEKRIFIDRKKPSVKVFKLTRNDDPLYYYGDEHGSILSFILDRTQFNKDTDNQELMICDYYSPAETVLTPIFNAKIKGNDKIKIGFSRVYTAEFMDDCGTIIPFSDIKDFSWDVEGVHIDKIELLVMDDNQCKIRCKKDNDAVGSYFYLVAKTGNDIIQKKHIKITDIYE